MVRKSSGSVLGKWTIVDFATPASLIEREPTHPHSQVKNFETEPPLRQNNPQDPAAP